MTELWDEKASVHMLPTQKSWDALDDKGCLNGLEVLGNGKMIEPPTRIPMLEMPDGGYKTLLRDLGFPEIRGEDDEL